MGRHNKVLAHRRRGACSLVALIGAAVLLTAACSSGSSGNSANSSTGSGSATAPIKVGSIMAARGPLGDPLFITAANACVKWTNTHGGVNGHAVPLTVLDANGDGTHAVEQLKQLGL